MQYVCSECGHVSVTDGNCICYWCGWDDDKWAEAIGEQFMVDLELEGGV